MTARTWKRTHLILTFAWAVAVIPTVLWWKESILWVGLMSCWANVASHFAAWQATRAEEANGSSEPNNE